jgi:formylglycine-generating enzyme required for sulfatase activity/tRNA A-37 threonylcarbamoyl transferase component Bud32
MADLFELADIHGLDPELLAQLLDVLRPEGPCHLRRVQPLGRGGMAEVWLAHDDRLERPVAMKVLSPELAQHPVARDRFLHEARATARLVHPGIVPVHEIGTLDDGRPFFTMAVVEGQTLGEVLAQADADSDHRLVELFRRVVDAVAYAHSQGATHRDLKPANVMVGPFGTVFVLDWGLVRWADLGLDAGDGSHTLAGSVHGTPGWMSPEQARGQADIGPSSDVFSLGLVLHAILHRGPPFDPARPEGAVQAVRAGQVPPCTRGPEPLRDIVARAVASEPEARYPTAAPMAEDLARWLDGEGRRARARELVAEAAALDRERSERESLAIRERSIAESLLAGVPAHAPAADKVAGWRHHDRAGGLLFEARTLETRRLLTLHAALSWDPEHSPALEALADHWRAVHTAAELVRDEVGASSAREQLVFYDRGRHAPYLDGRGSLVIRCRPGALATLYRLVEVDRRRVPTGPRPLGPVGPQPLELAALDRGSWLLTLERPGAPAVPVPVWIGRGACVVADVVLPEPGALGPDDVFVAGGAFQAGTPGAGFQSLPWREETLPSFVIRRYPVTNREYLAFLDDLVAQGREDLAVRLAPHERGARPDLPGPQCYARTADGRFALAPDAEGDVWDLDWPVFLIDHHSATAYAEWLAGRTGRPWRLPTELEWEKAARGVDGRSYPWGDRFDPSFACVRASHAARPLPASIFAFEDDRSVYGVRGMAGNVRDWCADPFRLPSAPDADPGAQKVLRGGCWFFPESGAHTAARYALEAHNRGDTVSFRLARSIVPADLGVGG